MDKTRTLRVLIVENSKAQALRLRLLLEEEGCEVSTAASAESALTQLSQSPPDLMIVDYYLPGLRGDKLCRRVRRNLSTRDIPILLLTAEAAAEDMARGLEAGADDFVAKSSDPAVLRARVQAFLRRRSSHASMSEKVVRLNKEVEEANRKLKATQTQLIRKEKMASLGQLVAGIAHEITNPLAFVLNNLFTVVSGLNEVAPETEPHLSENSLGKLRKVRARLEEMGEGLDRIKELLLDLRTFSRLDEGEFTTIDVVANIDSVLRFLQYKLNGRIEVEKQYGPARTLSCYAGRLNQVFMNLISNAADAILVEGKITITTGQSDDVFFISVRDTGAGIPEAVRNRIFEPFFTTKPGGQGAGLGLAIAYGIIQDHHGSIEVQSQEGVGSEFRVEIPRDLEKRKSA